jgi:hypothetical protein
VTISEIYSNNPNGFGNEFIIKMDSLRTPKLANIVDALKAVGKGDSTILESKFWKRPTDDELVMWYVLREIHYNNTSEKKKKRSNLEVAKEVIAEKIDDRWLLDNYYYRIHGGLAMLFNNADLSNYSFNLDSLNLKNKTEKAICYFGIVDCCAKRFRVLQMMKNNKKLMEFADKMPKINGKEYFYFKDFDYPDFKWIGYEKEEDFNERNIGDFYQVLMGHMIAANEIKGKKKGQEIYFNSILFEPKLFKYSTSKADLQAVYDKSKK